MTQVNMVARPIIRASRRKFDLCLLIHIRPGSSYPSQNWPVIHWLLTNVRLVLHEVIWRNELHDVMCAYSTLFLCHLSMPQYQILRPLPTPPIVVRLKVLIFTANISGKLWRFSLASKVLQSLVAGVCEKVLRYTAMIESLSPHW
jgi:hypothetical protein